MFSVNFYDINLTRIFISFNLLVKINEVDWKNLKIVFLKYFLYISKISKIKIFYFFRKN